MGKFEINLKTGEKTGLRFPISEESIMNAFGTNELYEVWEVADVECFCEQPELSAEVEKFFWEEGLCDIREINEIVETLDAISHYDEPKVLALIEYEGISKLNHLCEIVDDLNAYEFVEADSDAEIGEYYSYRLIESLGDNKIPDVFLTHFNYESYGKSIRKDNNGALTSYGYIVGI